MQRAAGFTPAKWGGGRRLAMVTEAPPQMRRRRIIGFPYSKYASCQSTLSGSISPKSPLFLR